MILSNRINRQVSLYRSELCTQWRIHIISRTHRTSTELVVKNIKISVNYKESILFKPHSLGII